MPNAEVLIRLRTEGQQQLAAARQQIAGTTTEVRHATAALGGWDKAFEQLLKSQRDTTAALAGLGDQVKSLNGTMANLDGTLASLPGSTGKAAAAGAVLGTSFTLIGEKVLDAAIAFGEFFSSQAALAEQTSNTATRLGLTITQTEQLQSVARIAGIDIGTLEGAAVALADALDQGGIAADKKRKALAELGVRTLTESGQEREYGQILLETITALSKVEDTTERVALSKQALGKSAAKTLQPMLSDYQSLIQVVRRLGIGLDENLTKNLAGADDKIGEMSEAWDLFKKKLAEKIAPIVIPVTTVVTTLIDGGLRESSGSSDAAASVRKRLERQALASLGVGDSSLADDSSLAGKIRAFLSGSSSLSVASPTTLSAEFSRRQSGTRDGLTRRLAEVETEYRKLDEQLRSGQLGEQAFRERDAQFKRLEREKASLESRIAALGKQDKEVDDGTLRLSDLLAKDAERAGREAEQRLKRNPPSLFGRRTQQGDSLAGGVLQVREFGPSVKDAQLQQLKESGESLIASGKQRKQLAEETRQIQLDGQIRLIELTDRDEYNAARRVYDLKRQSAESTLDLKRAEIEYETKLAEIAKRRDEQARESAGRIFDALVASDRGVTLGNLARGVVLQQGRAIFQNVSSGLLRSAGGTLGRIGEASGLGGLLRGTLFDPANAKSPEIASRDKNTVAIEKLTTAVSGRAALAGQLGLPGLPGLDVLLGAAAPGATPPFVAAAGKTGGLLGFLRGILGGNGTSGGSTTAAAPGQLGEGFGGGLTSVVGSLGLFGALRSNRPLSGAQISGNVVGSAAALGLGTYGLYSGIQAGGGRGVLTAASSGLGLAATIPGPPQPFLQAASLVTGLVSQLFPTRKEIEDRALTARLDATKYAEPKGNVRETDAYGNDVDADKHGRARVPQIVVQVNALDVKSIMDRRSDLAAAIRSAVLDAGDDLPHLFRERAFGY